MSFKFTNIIIFTIFYLAGNFAVSAQPSSPSAILEASDDGKSRVDKSQKIKGRIKRDTLKKVVQAGVPHLLAQVRLKPLKRKGRFVGFLLAYVQPQSLVHQAGFLKNDVILKVNNEPIGRPEQMMHTLSLLPFAQTLVIDFERSGVKQQWSWLISSR